MRGQVIISPASQPQAVFLLNYAGTWQPSHRPGPSDRTVLRTIRAILTLIVLLPFAAGSLVTLALLVVGGLDTLRGWLH